MFPQTEVDNAFADVARNVGMSADQFTEQLKRAGLNPNAFKARLKADLTWSQIVRGRFANSLQVGEKDIFEAEAARNEPKEVGLEYTLHPITFVVPRNSPAPVIEARKREADMLRTRFQDCASGLSFARALRDVVVRPPIRRNSADLSPQLREVLAKVEVGKVTPPEVTTGGVEVFALCEQKETNSDSPDQTQAARRDVFQALPETGRSLSEGIARRRHDRIQAAAITTFRQGSASSLATGRKPGAHSRRSRHRAHFGAHHRRACRHRLRHRADGLATAVANSTCRPSISSPIPTMSPRARAFSA